MPGMLLLLKSRLIYLGDSHINVSLTSAIPSKLGDGYCSDMLAVWQLIEHIIGRAGYPNL